MSDKLNVLIVHNYYQIPGGEDTVVSNEMRMLSRYGHNIVLYTRNNSELKEMNLLQKVKIPFDTIFSVKS